MQRYFSNNKIGEFLILSDEDKHHIFNVMRMKNNDKIEVVYQKELYICSIFDDKFKVLEKSSYFKEEKPTVNLILPLLKESKLDLMLQKSTELLVDSITVLSTERTIVNIKGKEEKKLTRWRKILKEASEQSKRIDIPSIEYVNSLESLCNIEGLKVVCSTDYSSTSIKKLLQNTKPCAKITLVIGPEGGFTNGEISYLEKKGFQKASFGKFVLRSETVPIYLMSIINYISME